MHLYSMEPQLFSLMTLHLDNQKSQLIKISKFTNDRKCAVLCTIWFPMLNSDESYAIDSPFSAHSRICSFVPFGETSFIFFTPAPDPDMSKSFSTLEVQTPTKLTQKKVSPTWMMWPIHNFFQEKRWSWRQMSKLIDKWQSSKYGEKGKRSVQNESSASDWL